MDHVKGRCSILATHPVFLDRTDRTLQKIQEVEDQLAVLRNFQPSWVGLGYFAEENLEQ
jgi:hypothetical protein